MHPTIQIIKAGDFVFPKVLTHTEIAAIPSQFWEQVPVSKNWKIDLVSVETIDSAFLALLVEVLRFTHQKKITLTFVNLAPSIRRLLEVYGIAPLFEGILQ